MAAAARIGDPVSTGHECDGSTTTKGGSEDVLADGIGIVREGDSQETHNIKVGKDCVPHALTLSAGSSTVLINGKGAGRKGDKYGSEEITGGSGTVFIGD